MLAYIIVGHPEWRTAEIRVFACVGRDGSETEASQLSALIDQGRLPIAPKNIQSLPVQSQASIEPEMALRSSDADLVIAGVSIEQLRGDDFADVLQSHKAANDVMFVHAVEKISID